LVEPYFVFGEQLQFVQTINVAPLLCV